jgi:DNA-nicking Smr family endonuclease
MVDDEKVVPPESVELPIDGVLDLHTFAPRDIPDLVGSYLDECRQRGILSVRLIHGKGTGTQKNIVRKILDAHEAVKSFRTADETAGGWGATLVELKPLG